MQALELGVRMVNHSNVVAIIERLMLQLMNAPNLVGKVDTDRVQPFHVEPAADSDGEDPEATLRPSKGGFDPAPALPIEYKVAIIRKILEMCSKESYAIITDFEWYIDILLRLVMLTPAADRMASGRQLSKQNEKSDADMDVEDDIACAVGSELRNVAVRVKSVRPEAVNAANMLITTDWSKSSITHLGLDTSGALASAAWIVGEFSECLENPPGTLDAMLLPSVRLFPPPTVCAYLQSIPKVLASITTSHSRWHSERKSMVSFLLAKVVSFLEPLAAHPSLEVQERAVELVELVRVCIQAVQSLEHHNSDEPYLLTKVIPSLFTGISLNPIAPAAQRNVPLPNDLDLSTPIHPHLQGLLHSANAGFEEKPAAIEFEHFYDTHPKKVAEASASDQLSGVDESTLSYQQVKENRVDEETSASKRLEQRARNRDDPFYIATDRFSSGTSTPIHEILKSSNGEDVDIDAIPIIHLEIGAGVMSSESESHEKYKKIHQTFDIATDEMIGISQSAADNYTANNRTDNSGIRSSKNDRGKKSILQVDSSGLGSFSIGGDEHVGRPSGLENHDADMVKALEEVEQLRLEMQRASERAIVSEAIPPEGTLVKKRRKKKNLKKIKGNGSSTSEMHPPHEEKGLDINDQDIDDRSQAKTKKKNSVRLNVEQRIIE